MTARRIPLLLFVLFAAFGVAAGCVSEREEAFWVFQAEMVARVSTLPEDDPVSVYLDSIGRRLLEADPLPPGETPSFRVLESWHSHSFALPNRAVFVADSLLWILDSDEQVAFVLAHELAHLRKGQARARWGQEPTIHLPLQEVTLIWDGRIQGEVSGLKLHVFSLKEERLADARAIETLVAAGYDRSCAAGLFSVLEASRARAERVGSEDPWATHRSLDGRAESVRGGAEPATEASCGRELKRITELPEGQPAHR